ncbi:MAG: DUF2723 domain-containing protein [Anaerolineales bacterium]|nr:MAG: DUF2723 domain-containing protein [Anaerolineales bacterium]
MEPSPISLARPARASWLPLAVGAVSLWLYVSTAAPGLSWANEGADGGDLIAAAMNWGVPHPSGYPTYCLLARLYALLPLGPIARRFNLFSATMAAAAVGLVCLCTLRVLHRASGRETWLDAAIGLASALAFAAGPTLWSQSTITEVYALHTFFLALCLYLGLREDLLTRSRHWSALGLAFGLGVGVHLTLLLMLPGLAFLVCQKRTRRHLFALAAGTSLGLAIYIYLPLAARGHPLVNWGDPSSWSGLWWVLSGKLYHPYAFALAPGHLLSRVGAWARLLVQQYTVLGVALAVLGFGSWIQRRWSNWALATGVTFVAYTVYAIAYDTADSYLYLIPTYLVAALWMAEGARTIAVDLMGGRPERWRIGIALTLVVLTGIPFYSALRHYDRLDVSDDRTAEEWTDEVLGQLPEGALLITSQDRHTFALDYAQWVEQRRQDLMVIDGDLIHYDWYIAQINQRHPSSGELERRASLTQLISANLGKRAVYLATPREDVTSTYQTNRCGGLWRITGQN